MAYHLDINGLIELLTAFAAVITILILWKYKSTPGVKYLIYLEAQVAIWALSYAAEFGTKVLETKVIWSQISYFGIAFLPLTYFLFTTAFSQKSGLLTKKNILLLSILPFVILPIVFTNDIHHLIWTNVELDPILNIAHYSHGPFFWVFFVYTEILILTGLYFLVSSIYKFSAFYKSQVVTLLLGSVIPVFANLIYITKLNPFPGFDWTPVSFVMTGFIIAFGIIRYRMFDLLPIARSKLVDTINDGIVVVNAECLIEDFNPAVLKVIDKGEKSFVGQPFELVFSNLKLKIKDYNREEENNLEIRTIKENEIRYYDLKISPLYNQLNRFSGNLIIFHDITHIKKTEGALKEINQKLLLEIEEREKLIADLNAFAHSVAHGLKNPLAAIVSTEELMEASIESMDKESLIELNDLIQSAANKTLHITKELLTLASVRKEEIEAVPISMTKVINEAEEVLRSMIKQNQAEIIKPKSFPVCLGYEPWIEEVWVNYISNAIKYGGKPPRIEIGSEKLDNSFIKYWIKDNGDGISKEKQELLFSQFTRLNPAIAQGHGLGLSIVKRILEKLGGNVGVESMGIEGEGCVFYFCLPGKDA